MAEHSTKDAIVASTKAIKKGVSLALLKQALIVDGFSSSKAQTIILWSLQRINHEKSSRNV